MTVELTLAHRQANSPTLLAMNSLVEVLYNAVLVYPESYLILPWGWKIFVIGYIHDNDWDLEIQLKQLGITYAIRRLHHHLPPTLRCSTDVASLSNYSWILNENS